MRFSKQHHLHIHIQENIKRIFFLLAFGVSSFCFNIFFASIHAEFLGALLSIILFIVGISFYYVSLFHRDDLPSREYIISSLFIIFSTVTMFAIIYSHPLAGENNYFLAPEETRSLLFWDAFYFSSTTITTLGYGDITPHGFFRLFVVIEVFMGIIYTGSMLYFITRHFEVKQKEKGEKS